MYEHLFNIRLPAGATAHSWERPEARNKRPSLVIIVVIVLIVVIVVIVVRIELRNANH